MALVVVAALNIYIDHDGHIRTNCRVDDKITYHLAAGGIFVITAVFAKAIIKVLFSCGKNTRVFGDLVMS